MHEDAISTLLKRDFMQNFGSQCVMFIIVQLIICHQVTKCGLNGQVSLNLSNYM